MNQTSENSREYQTIRSEIAHIAETIKLKRGDIADLEKLISEKQLLREEAADRLLNAKKLLAYRKMTTEQYLALASSSETLAREIDNLKAALNIHKSSIEILGKEQKKLSMNSRYALRIIAERQADQDLDALVQAAQPLIERWISKVIVRDSPEFNAWGAPEREAEKAKFYQALCRDLFKKMPIPSAESAEKALIDEIEQKKTDLREAA